MNEVNSGWFIKFNPDEKEFENDLIAFLENEKYDSTPEGLKEFLYDVLYNEEDEEDEKESKPNKKNIFMDAVNENPEMVQKGIETFGNIIGKVLTKKFIKTKP